MKNAVVRLESLEIKNFKNVKNGYLSFENSRKPYRASVLGLYGQNGSGKTALIDALSALKLALSGQAIPLALADFVNVDAEFATLKFGFKVTNTSTNALYNVSYEMSIRKELDTSESNTDGEDVPHEKFRAMIFDEVLSYSYECGDVKVKTLPVIDTRAGMVFGPKTKYDTLVGNNKFFETDLLVAKRLAAKT